MHHRTVAELMTRDVVRARRDPPFKEIVKLLADNGVTAVPVADELDRPIGVVSEADLLRKSSAQADPSGLTPVPHLEAWERARAEGARAEELMSAPAVCARPEWTVVEAARVMEVQNVERLPVVDETDRLQGIIAAVTCCGCSCAVTTPSATRSPRTCCGERWGLAPRA